MALTKTLAEMRTDIRDKGGYHRSTVFTDAKLNRWINEAIREVYDLLVQKWEDYYTERQVLYTAAGFEEVPLPSDFYKIVGLFKVVGTDQEVPLRKSNIREMVGRTDAYVGVYGRSYLYRLQKKRLHLRPVPTGADVLHLYFIPYPLELEDDTDTWDTINGYERLIEEKVLLRCDLREEKPTVERERVIQQMEDSIRRAADARDAAEPFLLPDISYGGAY